MKEIENFENIYLDEKGYNAYLEKINEIKNDIEIIDTRISKIILEERIDDLNSEYGRLKVSRNQLKEILERKEQDLSRIIIVARSENNNTFDIGDVVRVKLTFPNGYEEEDTFELVAGENDLTGEISKISINRPLGKSIYKKSMGESGFYVIKEGKVIVTVLEKIEVKKYLLENN